MLLALRLAKLFIQDTKWTTTKAVTLVQINILSNNIGMEYGLQALNIRDLNIEPFGVQASHLRFEYFSIYY